MVSSNAIGRTLTRLIAHGPAQSSRSDPVGVTIAIPNWNHELVLPRSIRSALATVRVLGERGVPAEVLVLDDQSRDGSLTLLRQLEALYFDAGLRVLALARNGGLPAARNHLLAHASYRYVTFMDADNELVPENAFLFYRAIRETRAAVVYGNLIARGDDGTTMLSNESFQPRMFRENYIDAFACVDKAQILDSGGYTNNPMVDAREDWELFLHLAANGRGIVFVPLVLGIYHNLADSMIKQESNSHGPQQVYLRRVFDQLGMRESLLLNTRHLRYLPDVGYI